MWTPRSLDTLGFIAVIKRGKFSCANLEVDQPAMDSRTSSFAAGASSSSAALQATVDEQEIIEIIENIRRRSFSARARSIATPRPPRTPEVLYSTDGDVVESYQVEINTESVGSLRSTRSEIDDTYDYLMGVGSQRVPTPRAATRARKPRGSSVRPRYSYSESLRQDIVETYGLVKYREEPSGTPVLRKGVEDEATAQLDEPAGDPAFEEKSVDQMRLKDIPKPKSHSITTRPHSPPRPVVSSRSGLTQSTVSIQTPLMVSPKRSPAKATISSEQSWGSFSAGSKKPSSPIYSKPVASVTSTPSRVRTVAPPKAPAGIFCSTGMPWFAKIKSMDVDTESSSSSSTPSTARSPRKHSSPNKAKNQTPLSPIHETLPRSIGSMQSSSSSADESSQHSQGIVSRVSEDNSSVPWYSFGKKASHPHPPPRSTASSSIFTTMETIRDRSRLRFEDEDDDLDSALYSKDDTTTLYAHSVSSARARYGCVPILEGILQGIDEAERAVMGVDDFEDNWFYEDVDEDDYTADHTTSTAPSAATTQILGEGLMGTSTSFCTVRKTQSGIHFFKA